MSASHLIRLGKIKGKNGLLYALKHNKRTIQHENGCGANIEAIRTPLNYSLTEPATPEHICKCAKAKMVMAGIDTPRVNAVMAVEIIFSLPVSWHSQDTAPFFMDCFKWTKSNFEGELLSFDVHLDEAAPHAHAIVLPLINGKMQGSDMVGGTGNLKRLINLFHRDVACHYGLSRGAYKRLNKIAKGLLAEKVLMLLRTDPVMKSVVWSVVRDMISADPSIFAQVLSIKPSEKVNQKSFVDICRSKGRGVFVK